MGFSRFSVGGCCCPSATCAGCPCNLPQSNLSASNPLFGTAVLVFSSPCTWTACFGTRQLVITVTGTGEATYTQNIFSEANCGGTMTGGGTNPCTPENQGAFAGSTCSPLNIILTVGGENVYTITNPAEMMERKAPATVGQQAYNVAGAIGRVATAALRGQQVRVDDETLAARRATCQGCEYLKGSTCELCGCFYQAKIALATEQCPVGKWAKQEGVL
jgi:hypothetical protein